MDSEITTQSVQLEEINRIEQDVQAFIPEWELKKETARQITALRNLVNSSEATPDVIRTQLDGLRKNVEVMKGETQTGSLRLDSRNWTTTQFKFRDYDIYMASNQENPNRIDVRIDDYTIFGDDTVILWVPAKPADIPAFLEKLAGIYEKNPGLRSGGAVSYDTLVKDYPSLVVNVLKAPQVATWAPISLLPNGVAKPWDNPDKKTISMLQAIKNRFEVTVKEETITEYLANKLRELKEIPSNDRPARAFVFQFLFSKLRADGLYVGIDPNGMVSVVPKDESKKEKAAAFETTMRSYFSEGYFDRLDIEQALIISSGHLQEYRATQADPSKMTEMGYKDFILKKYYPNPASVQADEVASNEQIPANERMFLLAAMQGGGLWLASVMANYDILNTQAKEVFDTKLYRAINGNNTHSTTNAPRLTPEEEAQKLVEDPVGTLGSKPLTALAATVGWLFALGYSKKEGFSLWTGLLRGIMLLIGWTIGYGVLKEWGVNPKEVAKDLWGATKGARETVADAASDATQAVVDAAGVSLPQSEDEKKKLEKLTPAKKYLRDQIELNTGLKARVDGFANAQKQNGGKKMAEFPEYLDYIETKLDKFSLEKLFATEHKKSIYSEYGDLDISLDSSMDPVIFKQILRVYMQGFWAETLTGSGEHQGETEKRNFMQTYGLKPNELKNKTLADILEQIHQKRKNGVPINPPVAPPTVPSAPTQVEVSGGIKVEIGTNVETMSAVPLIDASGNSVNVAGKTQIGVGEFVQVLSASTKQIGGNICIEVEYAGNRVYVPKDALKP